MKKYIAFFAALIFIFGCGRNPQNKVVLAKVNNYEITREEFNEEFKESLFGKLDTLESKKEFLNNLINRKLIMQDAQEQGLDKDASFLKLIEKFWEQSLLKLTLDKKTQEIAGSVSVSDKEIRAAYNTLLKDEKTDKPYEEAYEYIKWELIRARESRLMDDWINQLHKKSKIEINYDLLKK